AGSRWERAVRPDLDPDRHACDRFPVLSLRYLREFLIARLLRASARGRAIENEPLRRTTTHETSHFWAVGHGVDRFHGGRSSAACTICAAACGGPCRCAASSSRTGGTLWPSAASSSYACGLSCGECVAVF